MPPAKPPPRRSSSKPAAPTPRASSAGGKPSAGQGAESAKKPARKPEPAAAPKAQAKQSANAQGAKAQAKQAANAQGVKAQAKQAANAQGAKAQSKQAVTEHVSKAEAKQAAKAQAKPAGKGQTKSPESPVEAKPQAESREGEQPQIKMVEEAAPSETSTASPSPDARAKGRPARVLSLVPPLRSDANNAEPPKVATVAEPPSIELEAPAPRVEVRTHTRPPLNVGDLDSEVLPISALTPIEGSFTGAPLLVHASPETIRTWGVLGSTMGRLVPGKSEGGYTFSGQARLFLRAVQRVDASPPDSVSTGHCSVVLRNTTGRPIQLQVKGGLFSKYLTPQFPLNSRGEPFNPLNQKPLDEDFTNLSDAESGQGKTPHPQGLFFRGPQAVLASGLLDAVLDDRSESERQSQPLIREDLDLSQLDDVRLGTRGAFEGRLTVQPGATVVVLDARHPKGVTLTALLDFTALDAKGQVDAGARFRLATISSPQPLTPDELAAITRSEHPLATAGDEDTGPTSFPPLQGVLEAGSVFVGERTLRLSPGTLTGDLVMSMPRRNAGAGPDAPTLTPTSGTSASLRATSSHGERTHDGARGVTYQLTYTLENEASEPREVELLLTSPRRHPSERFFPQAGVLSLAMKVDGERVDVRVNQRGEGRVLAVLELPPEDRRQVRLEWTHAGGTFPPAGLELRVRR
ncbi:hypothetical protein HUW62_02590 [Myxococcus sp. AM011]|uniref:hypothetical protein n=1 Tax=Myxococcus sp. AM011 TaxID=2745200 RepID=UPI0015963944|nr:hypothetical protein [Myxococcus sp. AM011]NVJ20110.1 hypothetical protein [Myxococcus sp. AM011]